MMLLVEIAIADTRGNLVIDGIPEIPAEVEARTEQYNSVRSASMLGWTPDGKGLLISTRFAETSQVHLVSGPGADRRQLTFFDEPVAGAAFDPAGDQSSLVLTMDAGGGEFHQIHRLDLGTGRTRMLTDGRSKNEGGAFATAGGRLAYVSTARNRKDFDLWLLDGDTPRLWKELSGLWAVSDWSEDDRRLLLRHSVSVSESSLHVFTPDTGELRALAPDAPVASWGGGVFSQDGRRVYSATDEGAEFLALVEVDVATGARRPIGPRVEGDLEGIALSRDGNWLATTFNEGGASSLWLAPAARPERAARIEVPVGIVSGLAFDPASERLAFTLTTTDAPGDVYVADVRRRSVTRWTHSETGGLSPASFVRAEPIVYRSFDGMDVRAWYFRPRAAPGPLPVVINIHGGPEGEARSGFNATFQYWVNELGVAVIVPNVRGSTGRGRSYHQLDNGLRREDSVRDIGALLDWIATRPELDASRVAVHGGSYGGYMVLASMIHFPDRIRCGIDSVGISNFVTFLENTEDYRKDLRRVEYGDERDPAMREHLLAISPTTHAARIRRPLFVVQGRNDPRVPMSESEQVVRVVRENGGEVWYLLANDEGHGFKRKSNRDYLQNAVTVFLRRHLLG